VRPADALRRDVRAADVIPDHVIRDGVDPWYVPAFASIIDPPASIRRLPI